MRKSLLVLLLSLGSVAFAQTKESYAFVERDSTLYLDFYRPDNPRADKACVVSLFGGGFFKGTRDGKLQQRIASLLTERGFSVACIDYRLGLKDTARLATFSGITGRLDMFQYCIDIAVEDCAAAVDWLCRHATELDIDTSKIVLTGSSAGAIAVLQMDWCRANGLQLVAALPKAWKPAAVVPYAGAIMSHGSPTWRTPPAPTLLMHGTEDKIVAYSTYPPILTYALYGAKRVFKQMQKQGYPCWIVRFEGIGHEVASWLPGSVDFFCGFVNQALSGRITTLDATMKDSKLVPSKWSKMTLKDLYGQ